MKVTELSIVLLRHDLRAIIKAVGQGSSRTQLVHGLALKTGPSPGLFFSDDPTGRAECCLSAANSATVAFGGPTRAQARGR